MPDPAGRVAFISPRSRIAIPRLREAGESALLAIRDRVRPSSTSAPATASRLGIGDPDSSSACAPVRADPRLARDRAVSADDRERIRRPACDQFDRAHTGALGRSVTWASRPADPATGRVDLSDFKQGAGDRGGFGYDHERLSRPGRVRLRRSRGQRAAGPALLLVGSSGTLIVTVNEQPVLSIQQLRRQGLRRPDTDLVRIAS